MQLMEALVLKGFALRKPGFLSLAVQYHSASLAICAKEREATTRHASLTMMMACPLTLVPPLEAASDG